ncbi:MAG: RDD family protein [Candidatus Dormiibacterota bacterium]
MTAGGPPLPPPQAPGQWDGGQSYLPPPPPAYPVATYYAGPQTGPAPGIAYAGFWVRVVASIIDSIIVFVPFAVVFVVIEGSALRAYIDCVNNAAASGVPIPTTCGSSLSSVGYWELIALVVELAYFVILWSQFGGTLGQRMLGLHVVDAATGRNIGIGRAIGRFVGYVISGFALDIGFIWVAFDARKQGWHDKIASTFVVRKV